MSQDRYNKLTYDERSILLETVLPNAERWARMKGSPLQQHGLKTLEYWGRELHPSG